MSTPTHKLSTIFKSLEGKAVNSVAEPDDLAPDEVATWPLFGDLAPTKPQASPPLSVTEKQSWRGVKPSSPARRKSVVTVESDLGLRLAAGLKNMAPLASLAARKAPLVKPKTIRATRANPKLVEATPADVDLQDGVGALANKVGAQFPPVAKKISKPAFAWLSTAKTPVAVPKPAPDQPAVVDRVSHGSFKAVAAVVAATSAVAPEPALQPADSLLSLFSLDRLTDTPSAAPQLSVGQAQDDPAVIAAPMRSAVEPSELAQANAVAQPQGKLKSLISKLQGSADVIVEPLSKMPGFMNRLNKK